MPVHGYNLLEVAKHATNAINASNIADAEIAPLTTTAQLLAFFTGRAVGYWNQRQDMEFHHASIEAAIAAGIFTDANVAAANTRAGLLALLTAINASLDANYQSGNRAWQ